MKKLFIVTMIICLFPLLSYGDETESARNQYKSAGEIAGNMTQDKEQARIMTEEMVKCMDAGVSAGDMQRIAVSIQAKTRDMSSDAAHAHAMASLGAARQIAQAGASSGSTAKVVRTALQKNYSAGEMGQLGTSFEAQVKNAGSATELANSFTNAIKKGAGADTVGSAAAKGASESRSQGSTNSGSWNSGGATGGGGLGSSGGSSGSRGGRSGR